MHTGQCAHCGGCSDHQGYGGMLVCNLLQFQDTSIQIDANKNRVISDNLPSLDLQASRPVTRIVPVIPLMPRSSDLERSTRVVTNVHLMPGVSYLSWMSRVLEEHPGEGYWLLFNRRLPISYKVGDWLYGLLHCGQLPRDEGDAEGEIAENTIEEEVI